MADVIITKQELIDAQKDAKTLEDVINGAANTQVTARMGRTFWTLATLNSKLNSVETAATQGLININNDVASVEAVRVVAESQMNTKVASVEQIFDDKLSEWDDEAQGKIDEWQGAISLITQEGGVPALAVSDASGQNQQEINNLRTRAVSEYGSTDVNLKAALNENTNLLVNETINVSEPYISKKTLISGRADKELYTTTSDKSLLVIADSSDINKLVDGVIVENMNFGSQPAVANDNVSAIQVARGKNGTIKYCNFSDTNTAIRVARTTDGATSQDNAQVGNNIFNAKTMGIELIYSKYNRTVGNAVHNDGVRVGLHALRWAYGNGNVAVGNNFRDRATSGLSLQVGAQNNVAVGNYIENVGQSAIQSNSSEAWDVNSFVGGFVAKNCARDGADIRHMSNLFLQGVIDTTELHGVRTDLTSGRNIIDALITNTGQCALNLVSSKNLVRVLVDKTTADIPVAIMGDDNLVEVLCAETTMTNTVRIAGNNNVVIVKEAGSGTVGLRIDGAYNTVLGNVKGSTAINGSNNNVSGCFNGSLIIGENAANNVVSGQALGSITDNGTGSNFTGLQGASAKIQFTGTTNSTGLVTINHGLKRAPKYVSIQVEGAMPYYAVVTAKTLSAITVAIRDISSTGAAAVPDGTAVTLTVNASM